MKKKSHFQIASSITGGGKLIPHSLLFRLGSVMPDLFLFSYIKGHAYAKTSHKTAAILEKLMSAEKWGRLACFRMGYRVHYLADYFTFPHDPSYHGGLMRHNRYEAAMRLPLRLALERRGGAKSVGLSHARIGESLRDLHEKYQHDNHSIESDIAYILEITDMIYSALLSASAK